MAWVVAEDVISRWTGTGEIPDDSDVTLLTLIGDAEALVLKRYPNIQARLDSNLLEERIIKMVVSSMVQRAYQTTLDGKNQYSYSSGPFSESGSYGSDQKRGLYLTEDEISLLSPSDTGKAFITNMDTGHSNFGIDGSGISAANVWFPVTFNIGDEPYGY